MGWVEQRPDRLPRACWRSQGKVVRRTCPTVDEAEQLLRVEEGCSYVPPAERRAGRPRAGVRGHEPSLTQYMTHGCRGAGCKQFFADYRKAKRAQKRVRLIDAPDSIKHGDYQTYCLGCKCDPCSEASRVFRLEYRDRRVLLHAERHADDYAARRRARRASRERNEQR